MADGYLNFDTAIDTSGFNKGTKNITNCLGGLKSALGKIAAAAAAAFSVKALIDFGRQAIETASDLQEVQNVVDTAFGDMSYKMEDFAETSIEQFGISQLAAKQTGSTFMAMAAGMGLAQDSASDMAVSLTGLSADMESFYNVSQDVASTALKSIFTGETETLKQFGIVMTDANLQAYALSQGITKATSEMSQAEKVQLRYSYVMQQTSLAQGDFAKTQDSWANQTRILSEQWKEFGATIGSVLMTTLLPAIKTLNSALSGLIAYAQNAAKALAEVFGFELQESAAAGIADASAETADNYSDIAASAEDTAEAQENTLASFDKVNKLGNSDSSSSDSSAAAGVLSSGTSGTISTSVDVDTSDADKKLTDFFKWVKSSFDTIFEPLKAAWDKDGAKVIGSLKYEFTSLKGLFSEIGGSFAEVWSNGTGEKTVSHILGIFTNVNTTVGNIADNLKTAWTTDNLGTDIVQHAADIWDTILDHVNKITKKISDWSAEVDFLPLLSSFDTLETALQPFADTVGAGLEDFFDEVLLPLAGWTIEDLIPTFFDTLSEAIEGITDVWKTAYPVIKEKLWDEFLQPVAQWSGSAVTKCIGTLGSAIKNLGKSVTEKQVRVLLDLVKAIAGIILVVKGVQLVNTFSTALGGLATAAGTAMFNLKSVLQTGIGKAGLVIAAGIAGWGIGSMIRDAIGAEKIDEFLFPIFDGIVNFFTVTLPGWWETLNEDILFPIYDKAVAAWDAVVTFFTESIPTFFTETVPEWFEDLWQTVKDIFSDFTEWWSTLFTDAWDGIKKAWSDVKNWFSDLWESIKGVFADVKKWFSDKFSGAWDGIKEAFSDVKGWFSERWEDIKGVFSSVTSWFGEKFTIAWGGIQTAFANVKIWFGNRWNDIKSVFTGVKKWFSDKFSDAWEGIKGAFSDVGEFFGGVWDSMTDGLTGAINKIIDGLNWLIGGLNSISFETPDWDLLPDSVQGKSFGINIPEIPHLATGTVVPANYGEFLAVLGDNKRETEVVSPLSTIEQAVANALARYGGSGGDITIEIPLNLDGRKIHKEIVRINKGQIRKTGHNPLAT